MSTASTTSPSASGQARSRSSPLTFAAMTPASGPTAAPAVVPASTTCSLPARVIRSCWLDTGVLLHGWTELVTRCYRDEPHSAHEYSGHGIRSGNDRELAGVALKAGRYRVKCV